MAKLDITESIFILTYLGLTICFGYFLRIREKRSEAVQFLLAGRRLTLPLFVATLVSSWYGGILGVGEFTYRYGISNWLVFGVPYYLTALGFAFLMARRARSRLVYTIPDQMARVYGTRTSYVSALFVFFMTSPAPYVLMLGVLLNFFFGWPLWLGVSAGALFSLVYVFFGGFHSVVKTDMFQFVLMFIGFILVVAFAAGRYGGLPFLLKECPDSHFVWDGGQGAAYIIVWYFIALQTFVEPTFYQRCFAARDTNVARTGLLLSVLFWFVFDFLTTSAGLYARAVIPNLDNPLTAYLHLSQTVLPPILSGLFMAGLTATVMSTLDSMMFISGMTLGRDFLWVIAKKEEAQVFKYTRIGLAVTTVLSVLLALYGRSVVQLWKELGSIATPALLFPVVSSFFDRIRMQSRAALLTMLVSGGVSAVWTFSGALGLTSHDYLLNIEPIYPGLIIAIVIFLTDQIVQKALRH